MRKNHRVIRSILVLFFLFTAYIGTAQYVFPQIQPVKSQVMIKDKTESLQTILDLILQLKKEINKKREGLNLSISEGERQELEKEIRDLTSQIRSLEINFSEIASGIDMELFEEKTLHTFDWSEELKEIIKPILDDIRGMTASPREIDQLRRETAEVKKQLSASQKARENLKTLITGITEPGLKNSLINLEKQWLIRRQQLETQLTIASEQLRQKLAERKSFSETFQELFRIFFKSRGRNILLALLAFLGIWITLWKFHERVKHSRFFQKMGRTFSARLYDLIYHIAAILIALLGLLTVLYLMGDWVLLTIVSIILFGIIWASRHTIFRFWEQAKLLLNLGTVREGERIIYQGLPWQIKSLGFYSNLINKELLGGEIRLPLRHLVDLHSRPWKDQEQWFPCKQGDWVLLADKTHGKIIVQTPEIVELVLLGGSKKTYITADFLNQNPVNLCPSFRVQVTFGIDYQHQAIIVKEIPSKLETILYEKLTNEGYGNDIKSIKVEFSEAGTSSLDVEILADFSGRIGDKYYILQRGIQRICVDACNTNGWVIPFNQITLHMASPQNPEIANKKKPCI